MIDKTMKKDAVSEKRIREITGVLLAIAMLCCVAGSQKVRMPIGEEAAENSGISKYEASGFADPTAIAEAVLLLLGESVKESVKEPAREAINQTTFSTVSDTVPEEMPGNFPKDISGNFPENELDNFYEEVLPEVSPGLTDTPGQEEVDTGENTFVVSGGFVCDLSGRIIDCTGVSVVDGVLCLPSDSACIGIATGALSSLADTVFEIYIPANIVDIDPTAFEELSELMYIEVHPENPRYGSSWGVIYEK